MKCFSCFGLWIVAGFLWRQMLMECLLPYALCVGLDALWSCDEDHSGVQALLYHHLLCKAFSCVYKCCSLPLELPLPTTALSHCQHWRRSLLQVPGCDQQLSVPAVLLDGKLSLL